MGKKAVILMLAVLAFGCAWSQDDTSRTQVHLSTGATVASGFGRTQSLMWVAPSVEHRVSDRLAVSAGFSAAGSLLNGYEIHGYGPSSLAPRRSGTRMGSMWASAEYRVSDRLWLWAEVEHLTGYVQPLWLDGAVPIAATAISGGMAYEFPGGSLLEMHFHFVHDHYGTARMGLLAHPWYGGYAPDWELYGGPWPF
jgi:hypothetical protein